MPETVWVTVVPLRIPEGVTVTLADGVPTPEGDDRVTVAEIVAPSATVAGAVIENAAASGWTVTFTVLLDGA